MIGFSTMYTVSMCGKLRMCMMPFAEKTTPTSEEAF